MSDLPRAANDPAEIVASHETSNNVVDHLERDINLQISQSIEEQQEVHNITNNANDLIDNSDANNANENQIAPEINEENLNNEQNDDNDANFEEPRLFNRAQANILRFFNNLFQGPDNNNNEIEINNDYNEGEDNDNDDEDDEEDYNDEDDEDDNFDFDEIDDEEEGNEYFMSDNDDNTNQNQEYENAEIPQIINYDTALPTSHNYLGPNFEEVSAPKTIHEQNDELQIPLISFPGNQYYRRSNNDIQLLPGQITPLFFYSPLQVQMIKKRMKDKEPTIGFTLNTQFFQLIQQNQTQKFVDDSSDETKLGILAEIISCKDESSSEDPNSMMHGTGGLVLKVKGRERFRILNVRKEITGCVIATVKILPDFVLRKNPLLTNCQKNTNYFYECYLNKNNTNNAANDRLVCSQSKAEYLNIMQPYPAWAYRKYDCDYIICLIIKELRDNFKQKLPFKIDGGGVDEENVIDHRDPLFFSNWLLKNFPFDDKMRIACLNLNCVNQRLIHMHSLLKSFTNMNCSNCRVKLCSKSDVFSISKQGFMNTFLNPGGIVHDTLTVYKLKNFRLNSAPPSTMHSWFPGYGWQIINCRECRMHIGWKFTATSDSLTPTKFFGLTRNSICHTYEENEDVKKSNNDQADADSLSQISRDLE